MTRKRRAMPPCWTRQRLTVSLPGPVDQARLAGLQDLLALAAPAPLRGQQDLADRQGQAPLECPVHPGDQVGPRDLRGLVGRPGLEDRQARAQAGYKRPMQMQLS
jgi:hypothetical protein